MLEIVNRQHTVQEGLDAVRMARDSGFVPHVDMIFGLPGEKDDDLKASLEACYNMIGMGARVHAHVFMPLPGSPFENMPPGHLDEETRKMLGELSKRGSLTGSWGTQEGLAKKLAADSTKTHHDPPVS